MKTNHASHISHTSHTSHSAPPSTTDPSIHQPVNPVPPPSSPRTPHPPTWLTQIEPAPLSPNPSSLLDALRALISRFVVLPQSAAETLALWVLHTYAFECRDVSTYIGIESPVRRCGKTTLLTLLSQLVNRPVVAANVSPPALFRAIEELRPTLLIDEADTFFRANDQLQGILNAGYTRSTAYVLRVSQQTDPQSKTQNPALASFSCWCPKVISRIGRLPETLADRCILIRMQRKTPNEPCDRLRNFDPTDLRRQCARFALDHAQSIANAKPPIPPALNDRAADIWEPLLALADLAGDHWPNLARQAALALSAATSENSSIGSLLLDIFILFVASGTDRLPTRELLAGLNTRFSTHPWMEARNGRQATEIWLAQQLRPFGISPRTLRLQDTLAKGYLLADFTQTFHRYIPPSELQSLRSTSASPSPPEPA